jgi:uncharacterized repeat protein (TIGR03803 family)
MIFLLLLHHQNEMMNFLKINNMKKIFTLSFVCFLLGMGMGSGQTQLWGTANGGTIFVGNGDGTNFHSVYAFVDSSGQAPVGALVLANNENFYGVTELGGCADGGVCYSYNPLTGNYINFHTFGCDQVHGYGAASEMMLADDGNLYGLCALGGANGYGVIYKVNTDTNAYTDIYDFNDTTGGTPYGILTQMNNGILYGMTNKGGANNLGVIFSFNLADSTFSELFSFNQATGGNPKYGGLLKVSDSLVYGMTSLGGVNNIGVIFSYNIYTGVYQDVLDFPGISNGANPYGGLIQATNGLLYGMTYYSGQGNLGTIFSFNKSTNAFTSIYDFTGTIDGNPQRSLMQATNGKLYGTTQFPYSSGEIFSYDFSSNTYTDLIDCGPFTTGDFPDCNLIETPWLTGIPEIHNKESITIYPNPASTTITIHSQLYSRPNRDNSQLIITDVLGNEIYHQAINNSNQTTIDISQWSDGVYFYSLTPALSKREGDVLRGKFVKE